MGALLVARLVAGLGGGVIVAGAMSFTMLLYEPRLRTRAIAFTSVTWIGCALLGPLIGGIFADIGWWRGAFWLYVPFAVAFLAGIWWKIPETADRTTAASRALRFPVWRLACLALGVICVGAAGRIDSDAMRVAMIVASVAICGYAFYRDKGATNRLFPSNPLSLSRPVGLGYWILILVIGAYTAISIYLPLVLTVLHGVQPLYVGAINALMSTSWSVAAALIAGLHGGAEKKALMAGPICLLLACAGFAAETYLDGGLWAISALAILAGFGIGFINVHIQAKCMAAAEPGEESITASSLSTVRSLGQAFGSAIGNTVANMAGLVGVATVAAVHGAAIGVYLFNLVPLALAALAMLRFFQVSARTTAR
jgi:predicted MFS family arabinose efflux permease